MAPRAASDKMDPTRRDSGQLAGSLQVSDRCDPQAAPCQRDSRRSTTTPNQEEASMTTTTVRRGLASRALGLALAAGPVALAPAALAQTDTQGDGGPDPGRSGPAAAAPAHRRAAACLKDAGVEKPADGQRPTDAQRAAFKAAAEKCGISSRRIRRVHRSPTRSGSASRTRASRSPRTASARPTRSVRRSALRRRSAGSSCRCPRGPQLTDEQRQCLKDAGLERPADGQRPTDAQREAFRAAAAKCGIDLPSVRRTVARPATRATTARATTRTARTQNASV